MTETHTGEHTIADLQTSLLTWGRDHFRVFPWRLTQDPYHVLITEMLFYTFTPGITRVYERFLREYPTIFTLVYVTKKKLFSLFHSSVPRWRIERFYATIVELITRFDLQVPQTLNELMSLPSVGEYAARTIRCFAWNLPEPVIRRSTARVINRVLGIESLLWNSPNLKNIFIPLVPASTPREFNYALLDLAYQKCSKSRVPHCATCPIQPFCAYGREL
jgi:A/G-specific adenine glycosylase